MEHKTWAYWIVGIVGAILIIVLIVQMNKQQVGTTQVPATGTIAPVSSAPSSSPAQTGSIAGSKGNTAYNATLAIYQKNGYRIQFSECHGTPGHLVVPQGVKFMLDNRDDAAHTIKVGPYSYRLGAYGYIVVTAENVGLNNVTCDGGGAAQVNIEK